MFIGTPRGAFTPILDLFLEVPPRVFLGILSEYLAQKYSPELVNKDFGDFLVTGYIYPPIRGCTPAHPQVKSRFFLVNHKNIVSYSLGYSIELNWLTLVGDLGRVKFCTLKQLGNHLIIFYDTQKKTPLYFYKGVFKI